MVTYNLEIKFLTQRSKGATPVRVTVRAQGELKHYRPDEQERFTMELPDGSTVRALIDASGIPWEDVGLVAVAGQQAADERVLLDGDDVLLLAPMEGG